VGGNEVPFDPKRHVIKVQGGREYLPVSARLRWFREEHPDWGIVTTPVEINLEKQYAIYSATIFNSEGKVMATATKMENVRGFGDYLEKAETGSVGRALAFCGYGTQYATELDENPRIAEPGGGNRFGARPNAMNGGMNSGMPANGANGSGGRPAGPGPGMPPRPSQNQPVANTNAAPVSSQFVPPAPEYDEPVMESPAPMVRETPEPLLTNGALPAGLTRGMNGIKTGGPKPLPADEGERPAPAMANNRPAPPGAPIARVREPEIEYADPGGDDEPLDDVDPFDNEELALTPAKAPASATARPGVRSAANAPESDRSAVNGAEDAPSNRCSVDGCGNTLTASQLTMSMNKYGKPVCLVHQRDMAPVEGGAKRPAARTANTLL
jgi:hypothetical protein